MSSKTIFLDGVRYSFTPPKKFDFDEKVQEVQAYNSDNGITDIKETTELGEALKELNDDNIQPNTRMSGIDMRSRLHFMEVSSILAVDSLVSFKLLPINCLSFTRQKKRLAVSLAGKGRDDIVGIVRGEREKNQADSSIMGKLGSVFRPKTDN